VAAGSLHLWFMFDLFLEYNSIIWSPNLKQEIMMIEKVQRRFTKRLHGCKALTYTDRLAKLALPSLELRRLHLDLIYCYKIIFGLTKLNFVDFFNFPLCLPGGMLANFSNQEVVTLESICLLVESSTCGTAYLILSVLLV